MSAEIIIGIGGLLISVLTYFAGVARTERRYKSQAKEKRIDDFVNTLFSEYRDDGQVIGLLISSGINDLQNDDEIKNALEKVRNRLSFHPLRNWNNEIESIGYKTFFNYIVKNYERLFSLDPKALIHVVQRSSSIKRDVVIADEKETKGIRSILNFGHTIGHAIEAAGKYNQYQHGEAVALGIIAETELSKRLGLLSKKDSEKI